MIKINTSKYTGQYLSVNQTNADFRISRWDLARAFMTIGYPKLYNAISQLGLGRFLELYFRTRNYVEYNNANYLKLKRSFFTLDPSEQKSISYFIGQSLTKLFAEKKLGCILVDNINNHKTLIRFITGSATFTPKVKLYSTTKNPREPDLLGISRGSEYHILEAKGYSSGFKAAEFQHAINQVSKVNTVNSKIPLTKSACFFDLSTSPFVGTIVDPDSDDKNLEIVFEENLFLEEYYSIFNLKFLNRKTFWTIQLGFFEFALFRVFPPHQPFIYYGVEFSIFEKINRRKTLTISDLPKIVEFENRSDEKLNYSIGPDGIIFLEIRNPLRMKLVRATKWV